MYGIITPVCSGKMYKGNEPLETEEIELAKAMILLLNDKGKNREYREKSKERRKNLAIQNAVNEWVNLVED